MTSQERIRAVAEAGFTERQARFLVTVMLHSGVCLPRQYAAFAGIAYGHKTGAFFDRLVERRYASVCSCLHNRARVYHVHRRALYRHIGEPESPHRRPVPAGRVIGRLMLLDAVLGSPEIVWLATDEEKVAHLATLARISPEHLPRVTSGNGGARTVRLFPDRLPIGIHLEGRAVFLFVIADSTTQALRAFYQRHLALLQALPAWTVRLLIPPHLPAIGPGCQDVARQELAMPFSQRVFDELRWYFEHRQAGETELDGSRYSRARRAFKSPRFEGLYAAWARGDVALENTMSPILTAALASGAGKVECMALPHRYRHLSPLVDTAAPRWQGVEEGATRPTRPRPPFADGDLEDTRSVPA
jgi:hypothetical protein